MRRIVPLLLFLSLSLQLCAQDSCRIVVGAERLDQYLPLVQDKHLAVVANQASRVGERHLVDTLLSLGVQVNVIFCPEHGFRGDAEAGAHIENGVDSQTGIPIVSLYGKNKKPSPEVFGQYGIDLVLFDLQDVGCRFYTYISTLHYVMEACAENPKPVPFILLDRPNPNAGYIDGPVLEPQYVSFVGMHPGVPIVYGMTIGEYARMIQGEGWIHCSDSLPLTIIPLLHYAHDSLYHLPIPPSPNLRTDQAIALYPSLCLFEGTSVSVGRGTDWPFEVVGTPSYRYRKFSFIPYAIPGVSDNPPQRGRRCYGLDLREIEPPHQFDLTYLIEMYRRSDSKSFFLNSNFFEKLAGTSSLRKQLKSWTSEKVIRDSWQPGLERFKSIRSNYLLYP